VYEHYKAALPEKKDMYRHLRREYTSFLTWAEREREKLPNITPTELLQNFAVKCGDTCQNLLILVELLEISPVTTAEPERVFSCMNRLHDDERASLSQQMTDDLMMLSMNGPAIEKFDFTEAVFQWYTASPRREKLSQGCVTMWRKSQTKTA
jgi:hypothetical protein